MKGKIFKFIGLILVLFMAGCLNNTNETEEKTAKDGVSNIYGVPDEEIAEMIRIQNEIAAEFPLQALSKEEIEAKRNKRYTNPTKSQIIEAMKKAGTKYNIPYEVMYAIGAGETGGYNGGVPCQYWPYGSKKGQPIVSFDDGIGVMQVTPHAISETFDRNSLLYDYKYNIEAGAQVILGKWKYVKGRNPIGDMNHKVLENWYIAIWAYNGLSVVNNPNMYASGARTWRTKSTSTPWTRTNAYQIDILNNIKREFGVAITPIPRTSFPVPYLKSSGLNSQIISNWTNTIPASGKSFTTPTPIHYTGNTPVVEEKINLKAAGFNGLVKNSAGKYDAILKIKSESSIEVKGFDVTLWINGQILKSENITIAANSEKEIKITTNITSAGSYPYSFLVDSTAKIKEINETDTDNKMSGTAVVTSEITSAIDFTVPSTVKINQYTVFNGTASSNIVKIKRQLAGGVLKDAGSVTNGKFSFSIYFDIAASKELTVFGYDAAGKEVTKITKKFTAVK